MLNRRRRSVFPLAPTLGELRDSHTRARQIDDLPAHLAGYLLGIASSSSPHIEGLQKRVTAKPGSIVNVCWLSAEARSCFWCDRPTISLAVPGRRARRCWPARVGHRRLISGDRPQLLGYVRG
jgi:hypothetical protein